MNVYFISDGNGHIKIGKSNNVEERLKTLQCGNAVELRVVHVIECQSEKEAFELESELHQNLASVSSTKKLKTPGCEWFDIVWNDLFKNRQNLYAHVAQLKENKKMALATNPSLLKKEEYGINEFDPAALREIKIRGAHAREKELLEKEIQELRSKNEKLAGMISVIRNIATLSELDAYKVQME